MIRVRLIFDVTVMKNSWITLVLMVGLTISGDNTRPRANMWRIIHRQNDLGVVNGVSANPNNIATICQVTKSPLGPAEPEN